MHYDQTGHVSPVPDLGYWSSLHLYTDSDPVTVSEGYKRTLIPPSFVKKRRMT